MTTLVVTNDFPPRIGGIESFVARACRLLDDDVAVLTSTAPGAAAYDADVGFPIERLPGPLLPTAAVGRAAADLLRRSGADRVLFGAAAPLGLLAATLRRAGAQRIVALTHGHEFWWATLPGSRRLLRRIGDEVDVLTTISDYVAERIGAALSPAGRAKLVRLAPPVDLDAFAPAQPDRGAPARSLDADRHGADRHGADRHGADRHGAPRDERRMSLTDRAGDRPGGGEPPAAAGRVVAVGRMVRRKGFDTLLRAWGLLGSDAPAGDRRALVLVGDGPQRARLARQVARAGLTGVTFTGALPPDGVLAELRGSDVFALPVRTRLGGLDPEGLGLAALEAAACGLPVVVGRSGGAPETVRHGITGYLIDPDDPYELAVRLAELLADPEQSRAMGAAGRSFVSQRYGADRARRVLRAALALPDVDTV